MRQTALGLREGALTLAYNAIVTARGWARRASRPTEMGVRALVLRDDAVLLVRHRGGARPWSLPGGGIGREEPLDATARREVEEEAGCQVRLGQMLGLYHNFSQGMSNYVAVFVCAPLGPPRPRPGNLEIVDAQFFRPRELPAATEAGSLRRLAEHARGEAGVYREW